MMVTRRCSERRMFLRPDHRVTQAFEYVLARALDKYGIELHAYVVMSNHYHLVLTDVRGELPDFQRSLNGLVARAINCLLGRWESFWDPHSYNAVELLGQKDVQEKMAYTLLNPVRAGLVGKATQWGGATSAGLGFGHCKVISRPDFFFSEKMPETVKLRLTAPPGYDGGSCGHR